MHDNNFILLWRNELLLSWALRIRGKQGQKAPEEGTPRPNQLWRAQVCCLPGRMRQGVGWGETLPWARPNTPKLEHTEKPHPHPQQTLLRQSARTSKKSWLRNQDSGIHPEGVAFLGLHGVVNKEQEGSKHKEEQQLAPEWDLSILA